MVVLGLIKNKSMKTFINIAIFIISTTIYSQDLEYLKKLDTIYIPYYGKANEKKYDIQTRIIPTNFKERSYTFKLDSIYLSFDHVQFIGWKKKNANIESETKKVKKAFLKKIKNKIISPDLLNQFDNDKINCDILSQIKVFYILDFIEKKRKVTLYEVAYMGHCSGLE
ncbi:hypothetical protein C8C83_4020 [Flavobacterium sp. 90]|nr:hypothetical protein C8C82_4351 [Flavobacterium sp. 81]TCK56011.1 hypothetical protein C8C83_4020 [Flavobacterium sp. 90]